MTLDTAETPLMPLNRPCSHTSVPQKNSLEGFSVTFSRVRLCTKLNDSQSCSCTRRGSLFTVYIGLKNEINVCSWNPNSHYETCLLNVFESLLQLNYFSFFFSRYSGWALVVFKIWGRCADMPQSNVSLSVWVNVTLPHRNYKREMRMWCCLGGVARTWQTTRSREKKQDLCVRFKCDILGVQVCCVVKTWHHVSTQSIYFFSSLQTFTNIYFAFYNLIDGFGIFWAPATFTGF